MTLLADPKNTIDIIKKYNFSLNKRFGQNFLIDMHVVQKTIHAAEITKDDMILEIGPGIGTLTQHLSEAAREVTAVEIDRKLIPILKEDTLSGYKNVTIVHQDILEFDIHKLVMEKNFGRPIKIVANLPYYITTPIIMKLFERKVPIAGITVMVQKEVAYRMKAIPKTKDYGALSLAVQYYAATYIAANVPKNCFIPRPNVDSAVIKLTPHEKPPVTVKNEKLLFQLIRGVFNQRRKILINSLTNYDELSFSKEELIKAVEDIGLKPTIRGEELLLSQFAELADRLYDGGNTCLE